jgi:hypothetical protein
VRDDRASEVDGFAARPDEWDLGDDAHSGFSRSRRLR